jgi:uncharacterized protein (DUF1330 family)
VAQSIKDDPSGSTVRSAGYVISLVEGVADMDAVRRYAAATGPSMEAHGGRFMASNSQLDVVEGHTKLLRASIVEFASLDCAQAWYASKEYAGARQLSPEAFQGRLLLFVEGVEASSPTAL